MTLNERQFGFWHGTTSSALQSIQQEGFKVGAERGGRDYGDVVYLTEDQGLADEHAFGHDVSRPSRHGANIPVAVAPGARVDDRDRPQDVKFKADVMELRDQAMWVDPPYRDYRTGDLVDPQVRDTPNYNAAEHAVNRAAQMNDIDVLTSGPPGRRTGHALNPQVLSIDPSRRLRDFEEVRW